jgi:hypothetical protein
MLKGRARSCILSGFAGWLVILASGDDFNFARVVFPPSTPLSEDLLPLDDPNTDFTQSSETRTPENSARGRGANPPSLLVRSAGMNRTPPPASPVLRQLSRLCCNTPLRC